MKYCIFKELILGACIYSIQWNSYNVCVCFYHYMWTKWVFTSIHFNFQILLCSIFCTFRFWVVLVIEHLITVILHYFPITIFSLMHYTIYTNYLKFKLRDSTLLVWNYLPFSTVSYFTLVHRMRLDHSVNWEVTTRYI